MQCEKEVIYRGQGWLTESRMFVSDGEVRSVNRGQDGVDDTGMVVDRGRVGTAGSVGIADILGACRLSSTLYFRREIVCSLVPSAAPRSAGVWS